MISDKALLFKQSPAKVRFTLYWHTKCRYHKAEWQDRQEIQATYWRYFSPYSPRNAAENETTIGISVGRSCRWLCVPSELSFDFWEAVVVCHFRVCNPIFHTPFLHHFGVE